MNRIERSIDLVRCRNGSLKIQGDQEAGELWLQPFVANLARWRGFEVRASNESLVLVAFANETRSIYYHYSGTVWAESPTPVFMPARVVRTGLPRWNKGQIVVNLRLLRSATGDSVEIDALWLSYSVDLELASYLIEFALPSFFREPVRLLRRIQCDAGARSFAVPESINASRMRHIDLMTVPERSDFAVSAISNNLKALAISPPPQTAVSGFLGFDYSVRVDAVQFDQLYQVEEIPSICLRMLETVDPHRNSAEQRVLEQNGQIHVIHSGGFYSRIFQATVTARADSEVRQIGQALIARIRMQSSLFLPPFGLNVFLKMDRGLTPGLIDAGPGDFSRASLESSAFRFRALYLSGATWDNQVKAISLGDFAADSL